VSELTFVVNVVNEASNELITSYKSTVKFQVRHGIFHASYGPDSELRSATFQCLFDDHLLSSENRPIVAHI